MLCANLINIYNKKLVKEEDTFKILINFVVEIGYKRKADDRDRLKLCLEAVLIDGLSMQSALLEFTNLRKVVVTVSIFLSFFVNLFINNFRNIHKDVRKFTTFYLLIFTLFFRIISLKNKKRFFLN